MKKLRQLNLSILFLIVIFVIPTLTFIYRNISVSQIENRTLADTPVFSKETLLNGEYFRKWEDYISDHIFVRDHWIKSYTFLNMFLFDKSKINNIVIGNEGTLLPFYTDELNHDLETYLTNIPRMVENLKKLDNIAQKNDGKLCFIGVPGQSSFFKERYPSYFSNNAEYFVNNEYSMFRELNKYEIDFINMNEKFNNIGNEDFYLKTDHHYSFKGAFQTYTEIINKLIEDFSLEIQPPLRETDMVINTLPNPILGSRNRQIYFLYPTDEKIMIAHPKSEILYEKTTNGKVDPKLYYISEDPYERPSYGIYMGGDHAETIIKTNREELPSILIFGDSFTNALEPLLYYHFNETRILDLRHYKEMSLYDYIEKHKPDVVLMIRDDLNYGNLQGNGNFDGN